MGSTENNFLCGRDRKGDLFKKYKSDSRVGFHAICSERYVAVAYALPIHLLKGNMNKIRTN